MEYDQIDRRLSKLETDVDALRTDVVALREGLAYVRGAVDRLSWLMPLVLVVGMGFAAAFGAVK